MAGTEWITIPAKFTSNEVKIMRFVMNKEGWASRNQFIRRTVLLGMSYTLLNYSPNPLVTASKFPSDDDDEMFRNAAKYAQAKMSPKEEKETLEIVKLIHEMLNAFNKHKPRGAQKQVKKKRGRPPPEGYR